MLWVQVAHSYKKAEAELSKPSMEYNSATKNSVNKKPSLVYSLKREEDTARLTRTFTQTTNYSDQNCQESSDLDFDEFKKQLFENYGLPLGQTEKKEEPNDDSKIIVSLNWLNLY